MSVIVSHSEIGFPGLPFASFHAFYEPAEIHRVVEGEYYYWWKEWRPAHISVEFEMWRDELARQMWLEKRPWWLGL